MAFFPTLHFLLEYQGNPRRKCKVGKNAILGLSRAEMVRNTCFHIELVSVTYGAYFSVSDHKGNVIYSYSMSGLVCQKT